MQIPFIKLAPFGQLQVFDILRLLTPQVQKLLFTKAPLVKQLHFPFYIVCPFIEHTQVVPINVEFIGQTQEPFSII